MSITDSSTVTDLEEKQEPSEPLIPGLPNEISEYCLLHLPYPHQALARSVSSSWNRTITNPNFLSRKNTLSLSRPYIFILASHKSTAKIQWQAFDPRSGRWFVLPPMPCPDQVSPPAFACSSLPRQGVLYVLGGRRTDTESSLQSLMTYSTSTNQWSLSSPMLTPRSFFAAGNINGKIYAAGGSGVGQQHRVSTVERFDPENDTWTEVAKMRTGLERYDAAVVGNKMYVTEGWTWPFSFSPRGEIYDPDDDTWEEMSVELREGWTGTSVVVNERLFVVAEHGNSRMKVYVPEADTWQYVGGDRFPSDAVRRPFAVSGVEGRIYVVALGLVVVVGSLFGDEAERNGWRVEWEIVEGPKGFEDFSPCNSQVVYG